MSVNGFIFTNKLLDIHSQLIILSILTWVTIKRRLAFHGHLVRKGRPRTTWLKDLATQANISYKEAITIPRDRKKWRSVGNPRRTPDE